MRVRKLTASQRPAGIRPELRRCPFLARLDPHLTTAIVMTDKTFVIRFKQPSPRTQLVIAARAETHGDQLVLLDTSGNPIARFPAEAIESWTEGPI